MVDLIDLVLEGFKDVVDWVVGLFLDGLQTGYDALTAAAFGTPTPETTGVFVFGRPTNDPWPLIYDATVAGDVMLVSLLLLVICVQARHTIRIFDLGSAYESGKTRKTAWMGAILIVSWYWVGVLALYLVDGFTIALMPDLETVGAVMIGYLTVHLANPVLALFFTAIGGLAMWLLEALLYVREVLLYVYLYGMQLAIAVAFGNVPVLSNVASRFARQFVPLAVLPLPAAVLFRGYDLLYGSGGALDPATAFLRYLVAVSLPVLAVYLTWKTFEYASPLTTRVLGRASSGAVALGAVASGGYVAGPAVASTAARWGPRAATGHAVAQRVSARVGNRSRPADSLARDDETGTVPNYRRSENDP